MFCDKTLTTVVVCLRTFEDIVFANPQAHVAALDSCKFATAADLLRRLARNASEAEHREVSESVTYLENVAGTLRSVATCSEFQQAQNNIRMALLQIFLKSTTHSKEVIERVFSITFPGTTEIPDVHGRFKTTREQLILDMALCMQRRRETRRDREIRFGWGDSSPQGSFDWFIFKYRAVKEKNT